MSCLLMLFASVGALIRADQFQVAHGWSDVQLAQHVVVAGILPKLRHAALGILHVAEHNRLSRARLLASRLHVAVGERLALTPSLDLGLLKALNAEGAFLHNAARTDGDVWVERQILES